MTTPIYRYIPLLDDAGKVVVRIVDAFEYFLSRDGEVLLGDDMTWRLGEFPIYRREEVTGEEESVETSCKLAFAEMCIANNWPPIQGDFQNRYSILAMRFLLEHERTPALAAEMLALAAAMKGGA